MKPLLLLHGAIGSSALLRPLAGMLSGDFKVYKPDYSGHGGKEIPDEAFSIQLFAEDVLRFMQEQGLEQVPVFGYSMGGYVAMYLARHYPEKISKVITLATKYYWDEETAAREAQMLNPGKMEAKIPAFVAGLAKLHLPADWKTIVTKTAAMMTALGAHCPLKPADYAEIKIPALLLLGDRDKMVTLEETVAVYRLLPAASMGMLPGAHHSIDQVDVKLLYHMIKSFL